MGCLHSARIETQNLLFGLQQTSWCFYAVHVRILAVRGPCTEPALARQSNDSCFQLHWTLILKKGITAHAKKLHRRNLVFEIIKAELNVTELSLHCVYFTCMMLWKKES